MNGQTLNYYFLKRPPVVAKADWLNDPRNIQAIRESFEEWNKVVGIKFVETTNVNQAQIRIGFVNNQGCWSYLGRDILKYRDTYNRTMNFGWNFGWWDPTAQGAARGDPRTKGVSLHEIGHTLDFCHEHQNPEAHFVWDEEKTIEYFEDGSDWTETDVRTQVLNPITEPYEASAFDELSIMGYDVPPGLITSPPEYFDTGLKPGSVLSTNDIKQAQIWYPPLEEKKSTVLNLTESKLLSIPHDTDGTEVTFKPAEDGPYCIHMLTNGEVFFTLHDGDEVLQGRDTEGGEKHPKIFQSLKKNKKYTIRVRVNGLKEKDDSVYLTAYPSKVEE